MRTTIYCVLIFPFVLSSCSFQRTDLKVEGEPTIPLIYLTESTNIIRELIAQNKIEELLEEHDPEQLALLLNNKSPAQMAFKMEVLSSTIPLVVVYYFQASEESNNYVQGLKEFAIKYDNQIKFVVVDGEKLFSLTDATEITQFPYTLLVKDRSIIASSAGTISLKALEQKLLDHLN